MIRFSKEKVKLLHQLLAEATGADIIQCIGRKFVLYRPKPEEEA